MITQHKPTLFDFVLIFIFVLIGVVFSFRLFLKSKKDKLIVTITQNNKLIYKDEISKDKLIHLNRATVEISNRRVRVKESDCPFKICVQTGWIQKENQQIICIPNRICITLKSEESKIDSVTY